ncbi:hypothetical protein [Candidatus Symbiopectobacterium sp. 'North America']|uniref:hypothetical protein n=1 Tax=Candidatus Symbiopectobacterium sp. 'North America' TaxID=2794574 RepID=UPI0018CA38B6|nr:hypothetical protein [Candidatus Symbiopectobacterium sp. 'North America']
MGPRREQDVIVFTLEGTPTLEVTNGQSYNALIQAGGTISANVTNDISNTTMQAGNGNYTPTVIAPTLASTQALSGVQQQNKPCQEKLPQPPLHWSICVARRAVPPRSRIQTPR